MFRKLRKLINFFFRKGCSEPNIKNCNELDISKLPGSLALSEATYLARLNEHDLQDAASFLLGLLAYRLNYMAEAGQNNLIFTINYSDLIEAVVETSGKRIERYTNEELCGALSTAGQMIVSALRRKEYKVESDLIIPPSSLISYLKTEYEIKVFW